MSLSLRLGVTSFGIAQTVAEAVVDAGNEFFFITQNGDLVTTQDAASIIFTKLQEILLTQAGELLETQDGNNLILQ